MAVRRISSRPPTRARSITRSRTVSVNLGKARDLALRLMDQHGLLEKGWRLSFDNAHRRSGCVSRRQRRLRLSAPIAFLNGAKVVRNAVLHQIAHALVRTKRFHGPRWRGAALGLGWIPPGGVGTNRLEVVRVPYQFLLSCPICEKFFQRDRCVKKKHFYCPTCSKRGGKLDRYRLQWISNPAYRNFNQRFRAAQMKELAHG